MWAVVGLIMLGNMIQNLVEGLSVSLTTLASKDQALGAALQSRDQDPFVHLGCLIYGLSEKEITTDVRAKTKQLTYGTYGIGDKNKF